MRIMKKIILFCALIITGIVCYTLGYCLFSFDNSSIKFKEKNYVMSSNPTIETTKVYEEEYILYPMYGEVLIFRSDGSFYDYTGIFLNDLTKEEQIKLLQIKDRFTLVDLYRYLESLSAQSIYRQR